MSADELKDLRYKRMRQLNNAASKRCRINRKRKFEEMESEVSTLESTNAGLTIQVEALEEKVSSMKKRIFEMIQKKKSKPSSSLLPDFSDFNLDLLL